MKDYFWKDELTELETHVLADRLDRKVCANGSSIKSLFTDPI